MPVEQILEAVNRARADPAHDGELDQMHGHRETRQQQHPPQGGHAVSLGAFGRTGMNDHSQQHQDRRHDQDQDLHDGQVGVFERLAEGPHGGKAGHHGHGIGDPDGAEHPCRPHADPTISLGPSQARGGSLARKPVQSQPPWAVLENPHVATSHTSAATSGHRRGFVYAPTFDTRPMNH